VDGVACKANLYERIGTFIRVIGYQERNANEHNEWWTKNPVQTLARRHPVLPAPLCLRLARGHGSRMDQLLAQGTLGSEVAPGLFEVELKYRHMHEWACTAEDVPSRRTKRGLHLNAAERAAVARWCAAHRPSAPADAGALPIEEKAWS
jgi:glycerol-3-phosphate dehydrogenase